MIKALPLHGNTAGNRWRFVIQTTDGGLVHSSRYAYASHTEALKAGGRFQVRDLRRQRDQSGVQQFHALGLKCGRG